MGVKYFDAHVFEALGFNPSQLRRVPGQTRESTSGAIIRYSLSALPYAAWAKLQTLVATTREFLPTVRAQDQSRIAGIIAKLEPTTHTGRFTGGIHKNSDEHIVAAAFARAALKTRVNYHAAWAQLAKPSSGERIFHLPIVSGTTLTAEKVLLNFREGVVIHDLTAGERKRISPLLAQRRRPSMP